MDLQRLKWIKNVKRYDNEWAYSRFKVDDLFKLAWRNNEANASKPEKNDLILLKQEGYVTHLVRVLDYKPERENHRDDFDIYRIVEVVWTIDCNHPPLFAKADVMFDYSEVSRYQGGYVMELKNIDTFKNRWNEEGGLEGFQNHIRKKIDTADS